MASRSTLPRVRPGWPSLRALASVQGGFFRVSQAAELGFSPQLLASHVRSGALVRARRGIYRLAQFPAVENEELVELWHWSNEQGVFSHETALTLHELSDVLPARVHMTVPRAWRRRAASTPSLVVLHRADLPDCDRTWVGLVPVTTPQRTLRDAYDCGVSPDVIAQAIRDGSARNLFSRADLRGIVPPRVGRPRGRAAAHPRSRSTP